MKKIFLTSFSLLIASWALAADNPATKGSCNVGSVNTAMSKVSNGGSAYADFWKANLGTGLEAQVTFSPGYGMTFVTLTIRKDSTTLAKSTMWIGGILNANSKPEQQTHPSDMHEFDALSISVLAGAQQIDCVYNFYAER